MLFYQEVQPKSIWEIVYHTQVAKIWTDLQRMNIVDSLRRLPICGIGQVYSAPMLRCGEGQGDRERERGMERERERQREGPRLLETTPGFCEDEAADTAATNFMHDRSFNTSATSLHGGTAGFLLAQMFVGSLALLMRCFTHTHTHTDKQKPQPKSYIVMPCLLT